MLTKRPSAFDLFSKDFDSMFMPLSFYTDETKTRVINSTPKANVYFADNEGYTIELAVPGYSREDFFVDVENGVLTVGLNGSTSNTEQENKNIRRREWSYMNFKRSFTLPENTNVDQVEASYNAGILNIAIPTIESKRDSKRTINIT